MIGKLVSHYRILNRLGEGGMGVVYRAEDTRLKRTVALKFLRSEALGSELDRTRFVHEAQAASALEHTNICGIHEIDETEDGQMYICMSYYEGETLETRIKSDLLEFREAIDIAIQTAEGLQEAHEKGIIHRDIKSANVMVTNRGQAKILDFGLSKLTDRTQLTRTGTTLGTVAYMSPEQVRGESLDCRTDIWSLGVVLYEMITGQLPFRGDYELAVMYSVANEEPQRVTALRSDVSIELEQIINKAMAKPKEERYQSVKELLADLHTLRGQMGLQTSPDSRSWVFRRGDLKLSRRLALLAVAVVAIAAILSQLGKQGARSGIPTGQPLQLTSTDAWHSQPALSPGGGRIAYVSDESGNPDIYVIGVHGGNPLQLINDPASDYAPTWFPDGGSLAFVSDRTGEPCIWKIGQLGGSATLLVEDAMHPAISPDGGQIAFSRAELGGHPRICVAPLLDVAKVTVLTGDNDGLWGHHYPAWSPDGQHICYSARHNLWVVPSAGGKARPLTDEGNMDSQPAWSPDGRYIYFSSQREGTLALWRVSARGSELQRITMGTGQESGPRVSLDGLRLAYSTQATELDFVMRTLDSGGEATLPHLRGGDFPGIAPDKSKIVFVSDRWGPKFDLWVQPLGKGASSSQPSRLTDHVGDASHPVFSPDGNWIAYYRIIGEERDIWTIPASGGQPLRFTDDPATAIHPAWSRDGSMLAFVSEREGGSQIWIAPVRDGRRTGTPWRLTTGDVGAYAPAWSPDGTLIAFLGVSTNQREVWVVPVDGSAPARQVTLGADAFRVRWDSLTGDILVSGTWNGAQFTLRRVSLDSGVAAALDPPVVFGSKTTFAAFDVSLDGHLLVYSREDLKGSIWVLEAEDGVY